MLLSKKKRNFRVHLRTAKEVYIGLDVAFFKRNIYSASPLTGCLSQIGSGLFASSSSSSSWKILTPS